MPLLASWAAALPHVRVSASRTGGRVLACPAPKEKPEARQEARGRDTTFEGEKWPVHKVSRGGWSERNLQRSAEETWADNARRIAELTAGIAHDTRAAFVLVGGDVRERTAVIDALPAALRDTAIVVDREVNPDSASFAAAAEAESARRQAEQGGVVLGDFLAELGRDDPAQRRAVEGLDATLTALRDGLAASVLLAYDPASAKQAWVGPELADAAASGEQLRGPGLANPLRDRVDAAVARSVCGTGAELLFLPPGTDAPADGIGALLRAPAAAV
jgi:hypothetical protein